MERMKLNLVFDGQRARPVTNTWKDAPAPRFTMGVKTELELRIMDRTGAPVDPFPLPAPGGDAVRFRFAVAEDFDPDTPAVFATEAVQRVEPGVFLVVLDNTRTAPMIHALGVSASRRASIDSKMIWIPVITIMSAMMIVVRRSIFSR